MKRIITLFFAVTLALGMTQCKKNKAETMTGTSHITLNVPGNLKTDVNTATGAVTFAEGDVMYVANHRRYVGTLTYHDGEFSGTISNAYTDEYLYFFHLGNVKITEKLRPGMTSQCTIDISDQTTSLPVISSGRSRELYTGDGRYTAHLNNECALVKFNVTTPSPYAATCVKGLYNSGTVYFSRIGNEITIFFENNNGGKIVLPPGNGERWAILPPQNGKSMGSLGTAFSGTYNGTRGTLPQIVQDDWLTDGIELNIYNKIKPEGALDGLFTVNSDGKQVYFSKGLLSYKKSKNEFSFYEPQYQMVSYSNGDVGVDYASRTDVNHFGWGTSGYNHGAVMYKAENTSTDNSEYYAYGNAANNLNDGNLSADWGHNPITNGLSTPGQWRVLTKDEWTYLISGRAGAAEKYGLATVDTYHGLVLLPDVLTASYEGSFVPGCANGFDTNVYTVEEWQQLEAAGAVFLIAGSKREDVNISAMGAWGYYWSSTHCDDDNAYALRFYEDVEPDFIVNRSTGCLVRLVCE